MKTAKRHMRLQQPSRRLAILPTAATAGLAPGTARFSASPATPNATSVPPAATATAAKPITSLLIANRGEIALRINHTARRLGIETTTLFTDPDRNSQHAHCSPNAIPLGAAAGYLDGPRIISLAAERGIRALHPGYGFLSENASFADKVKDAGIAFVGPPGGAMLAMGDKARSKVLMEEAGVPCVPGYHGSEQSAGALKEKAGEIGYPVLLKSVRGGGGKGMRIVETEEEFEGQLESARMEAQASFGEGGEVMLVERYIGRPRHVEVQVFADTHGNVVALGERDCSVQRRHQKILEESPAPNLSEEVRQGLWSKARDAAKAVGYVGAGTVEFILDVDSGRFFFMEMNTRLQVEHPVTEAVCGEDLVEWQLRIASGEKLPKTQEEIEKRMKERGWAIEARIYAESPERGFLPDSGKLVHLKTPPGAQTADPDAEVRIDAGFVEGDTVTEAYDGMIAKLIVRGRDREEAIRKTEQALKSYEVVGPSTNIEFLKKLCNSPSFVEGDVETGFIDKHRKQLFADEMVKDEVFIQASLGLLEASPGQQLGGPHGEPLGFAAPTSRKFEYRVLPPDGTADGEIVNVVVEQDGPALYRALVIRTGQKEKLYENLVSEAMKPEEKGRKVMTFFPTSRLEAKLVRDTTATGQDRVTVFQLGGKTELALLPPSWVAKTGAAKMDEVGVTAPMPCKVLRNEVEEGQKVTKGTPLVVIESMKMETVIRSPQDGIVRKLAHKEGDICKAGTVLVLFEEETSDNNQATRI
ncbi:putative methylcrotonoyl- carboxylase subunit alpha protein [Zalerion maritima]|uniref:Methylcrotonoyl- carboxylase subunit alpha protein n=1 Tax=Zalerion maritima TaxID=339359 RepID=A0AAD5RW15_9PEZI|nr:putative methylcrotonoyl- carboxylase subunit alpha protein [Zalerion maritima]